MSSRNKEEWRRQVLEPALKRFPQRQERFLTSAGIEEECVYTPEDLAETDYGEIIGYPGEYPFTRGVQPTMYRGRLWTMRQYAGYASAEETNRRNRYLLEQGQTGLSIAFDLPTQMGYDSDDSLAQGEVGKVGVPICTIQDMGVLFQDIPLDKVSTSMTINATAPILLAMYLVMAKRQGVDWAKLDGTIQNDILKEYVARGTYIFPPRFSLRLITDVFQFCAQHVPRWNTISISGYHIREAGSTAAQELAFTLANAIGYVQAAIDVGLDVDDFAGRLSFFFGAHNNLFEEVAKFRAARRLWARIMRERFGAKDSRSWMLRFHTQTCGCTLTAQQPDNNIIRCTMQTLAAILGGTQSLHTNSRDEALALPSEEAVQISLRTQQILAYESGVADSVDPLGGSYMVESLTDAIEANAREYMDKIESMGGALAAIEQGYIQREIQESAYRYQRDIEEGGRIVVGVNRFVSPYPSITGLLRIDRMAVEHHLRRLDETKRNRDNSRVAASLEALKRGAQGSENTMPLFLDCVEAQATIGEMCDVLRSVFGQFQELVAI
ncbi:MAG: methylmalonyl-CoA mutase family protein [Chloroflexi bacterium]|nr:methylmalonyl-CoA mutase family protein [Chloroflexota bacterium]